MLYDVHRILYGSEMHLLVMIGVGAISLAAGAWCWQGGKHYYAIQRSRRTLDRLQKIAAQPENAPARQFGYLRQVNPYVFEELVLSCFELRKVKIKRNSRWSGDGGIDGRIKLPGDDRWTFLQMKRYRGSISRAHIEAFVMLCAKKNVRGLFVHTGKTPASVKGREFETIEIISGERLLALINGYELEVFGGNIETDYKKRSVFNGR